MRVARGVEDEDEEDAYDGEADEDQGRDCALDDAAGEERDGGDEEDERDEAEDGGGVHGERVVALGDVVRGGVDEARAGGEDGFGVGVCGVARGGGDAVGRFAGGGGGFFGGGGHWDVGWWSGGGGVCVCVCVCG